MEDLWKTYGGPMEDLCQIRDRPARLRNLENNEETDKQKNETLHMKLNSTHKSQTAHLIRDA